MSDRNFSFGPSPSGVADRPRLARSAPFVLAYAGNWGVVGGKVQPLLVRFDLLPGTNNITDGDVVKGPDGSWSYHPAIRKIKATAEKRGHVVLNPEDGPDGDGYITRHPARGGYAHLPVYELPVGGADSVRLDAAVYAEWIAYWQAAGVLPQLPSEGKALDRIAEIETILDRESSKPGGDKSARTRSYAAELEAWRAVLPKVEEAAPAAAPVASAPKKRKSISLDAAPADVATHEAGESGAFGE